MKRLHTPSLLTLGIVLGSAAAAQSTVFVGSSIGGDDDPWWLVDADTGAILDTGSSTLTDNVTGAAFSPLAQQLFVASSITGEVNATDASGAVPAFNSASFSTPVSSGAFGLAIDPTGQRAYTMGQSGTSYSIIALDADPESATYGAVLDSAPSGIGERWALSPDGTLAVSLPILFGGNVALIDTDPASATYLEGTLTIPTFGHGSIAACFAAAISDDNRYVTVVVAEPFRTLYPRYDTVLGNWVDVDLNTPGPQHMEIPIGIGTGIQILPGGDAALVTGWGHSTQQPFFGRLEFGATPDQWSYVDFPTVSGQLNQPDALSLSADGQRYSVTSAAPSLVVIGDAATGAVEHSVSLPGSGGNLYATAWSKLIEVGESFCSPAVPNSTGNAGSLFAVGSDVAAANDLTLTTGGLPPNSFGYMLTSQTQGSIMNPGGSMGVLCVVGNIGRYNLPGEISQADANGTWSLDLDLTFTPTPGGRVSVLAGETWNFQAWYRDVFAGSATSNFTEALTIDFQ